VSIIPLVPSAGLKRRVILDVFSSAFLVKAREKMATGVTRGTRDVVRTRQEMGSMVSMELK
jgi:hypothetical protein